MVCKQEVRYAYVIIDRYALNVDRVVLYQDEDYAHVMILIASLLCHVHV